MENDNDIVEEITQLENQQVTIHPFTKENLSGFKGRMNRLDYAILWLAIIAINWLIQKQSGINPIITAFTAMSDPEKLSGNQNLLAGLALFGVFASAYISIKRFHDIGYNGMMAIIFLLPLFPIPFFGFIITIVVVILKLILLFAPGTPASNQFGNPPIRNHKNKVFLLFILLFLLFILYRGFSNEAMPVIQPMLEEMMEQAGA